MTVWMRHPSLPDALIEIPDAAVIGHRQSGWRETEPPPPPELPWSDEIQNEPESASERDAAASPMRRNENINAKDGEE